jgi:hypothetical protein
MHIAVVVKRLGFYILDIVIMLYICIDIDQLYCNSSFRMY